MLQKLRTTKSHQRTLSLGSAVSDADSAKGGHIDIGSPGLEFLQFYSYLELAPPEQSLIPNKIINKLCMLLVLLWVIWELREETTLIGEERLLSVVLAGTAMLLWVVVVWGLIWGRLIMWG
jgi:hypothetical protein